MTTLKPLTVWITTNWKILKEMGILDHFTCLPRSLNAGQEITVRTGHGTTDWFKIGEGVWQGCKSSLCLFNLYAEYIIWNPRLDESQAGIKTAGRNINNLTYADDTILMAESEEELKSFLMRVKEESDKAGIKLNIQKTKIMASSPITSWQIEQETVTDFIFLGSKITEDGDWNHEIKRCLLLGTVMYRCAFKLWCWRRLLTVPWTVQISNQLILKEINSEYSLEGLMLKFQDYGHLMGRAALLERTLMLGKTKGKRRRRWQKMRC